VGTRVAQVRLGELAAVSADVIDLDALKAVGVVPATALRAKVFASGKIEKAVHLKGIAVTKGAREAIEAAKGKIED
jgi:large subunit ribosomal protein L15